MQLPRPVRAIAWAGALLGSLLLCGAAAAEPPALPGAGAAPGWPLARRVVSLNPSLTQILLALSAREVLVGVDDFSARLLPQVADLPRVGGLFNPSVEAMLALTPDLVVLVPSAEQRSLRDQLEGLGVPVLATPNVTLEEILSSIEQVGARVGREREAAERVAALRAALALAGPARERAVLVLQRDPLFIAGAGSFLDALLRGAGLVNAGASFPDPYPRVALEWLLAAAPELILDASGDPEPALRYWSRWPSLPAVARGRVIAVAASDVTMPGPHLDRALAVLRRALAAPGDPK